MKIKPLISVVSPVYNAENTAERLVEEILKVMQYLEATFEVILVDDRSKDNSWEVIKKISVKNNNVKSIRLSRNFGQHPAIMAGLTHTKGEWVVVMDCDLQDQPKEIAKLYKKAIEGYDVVFAKRSIRNDSYLKKLLSKLFSSIFIYLTETNFDHRVANYGIYKRKVINSVMNIGDYIKTFSLFVYFTGFNTTSINVEHASRTQGKSNFSYTQLLSLAFNAIISYSTKPLKIFVKFGIVISFLAFIGGLYNIWLYFTGQILVSGYSSLIVSIWFLSGVIITVTGVVGIYVGKVFEQTKQRPAFIIDEIIN